MTLPDTLGTPTHIEVLICDIDRCLHSETAPTFELLGRIRDALTDRDELLVEAADILREADIRRQQEMIEALRTA